MKALCLIIWMILTLVLAFSIVGMLLFIPQTYLNSDNVPYSDNVPSTWMQIGLKLLNAVTNENKKP